MRAAAAAAALALLLGTEANARAAADGPPLAELGRVLVLSDGRVMPMDSWARLLTGRVSGTRSAAGEAPLRFVSRLLFSPASAQDVPIIQVAHPDTMAAIGLGTAGRGHYSLSQLAAGRARLTEITDALARTPDAPLDAVEADLVHLRSSLDLLGALVTGMEFTRPGFGSGADPALLREWSAADASPLLVIPGPGGSWLSPAAALLDAGVPEQKALQRHEASLLAEAAVAWSRQDWGAARAALSAFNAAVAPQAAGASQTAGLEILVTSTRPFLVASLLSLASALLWLAAARRRPAAAVAAGLLAAAVLLHAAGLAARIIVTGRPPVTNLYSSFLFVAWLLLGTGLVAMLRGPRRSWPAFAALGAALLSAISSRFALEGDQLGVLQAVLDTNFWLSTHVVAISIGYTTCLAAGAVGHAWLIRSVARPGDSDVLAAIARTLSATLLAALLFTFLGTILGGIWADQSWGRFWGWDPKENGALLIILWITIIQHARLSGLLGDRGFAAGSVLLVVVVLCSWLGVNLLGVGLHSYGWTRGTGALLAAATVFEAAFVIATVTAGRRREAPVVGQRTARVTEVRPEAKDTVTVTFSLPRTHRITAPAGRYITVFARVNGVTRRRAYSLSSLSASGTEASITVRRVDRGIVSGWIVDALKPGTRLTLAGPAGQFGLNGEDGSAGAVFVAAGSGIAPLAAMAEEWLDTRTGPLLVLQGSRTEESIIFRARLEERAQRHAQLTVRHVLAEPGPGWDGARGWLDGAFVLRAAPPAPGRAYYLCGSPRFVADVGDALRGAGVPPALVHGEAFTPGSSGSARRASRGAAVRFLRSGVTVRALPGQSILEAGLRAGLRLPFGCTAGQCRECAARLAAGHAATEEPSPLSAAERDIGVVLTCVAYPDGDIDIDL
jgi:ferredoxin-NADP reductase/ABC-type transport system involved in cytochrome c biogenesis permease subunit